MPSLYRKPNCTPWYARVKLWDAQAGKWVWKSKATGCEDENDAMAVAVAFESASHDGKTGRMTRARAESIVTTILQLAGSPWGIVSQTLAQFGGAFIKLKMKKSKDTSKAKFSVHWSRFKKWAGADINWPLENWTAEHMSDYYADLLEEYSERTASDHLSTFRTIFDQAEKRGIIRGNPVSLVDKQSNASVVKRTFSRTETAHLLRAMRREKRKDWCLLTLEGWHTGHRIQDLLSTGKDKLSQEKGVGWVVDLTPAKKRSQGGRTVVLPIPAYVAKMLMRLGNLKTIHNADNRNGLTSTDFVEWLKKAGIDPMPIHRGKRVVHLKSFHSFRHSMSSRLTAAGVSGELSRLVTDHDSAQVQHRYVHAEIKALAEALKQARQRK